MSEIKTWQQRVVGFDPMTPLTIPMQEEITDLRTALADRDAKLAVLEGLYLNSLVEAPHWQLYEARKDAVIAAGMGRKAMRDAAAGAAPTCSPRAAEC